ncbi:helix-turn-helix domain-containing protein [Catenovulum sediminis]|uniref:Helix-turn-helix transcriptional regulator n=1 Tax=Catenovulum sediminis TaxID=1740262 RepID=A0ABV1RF09_9ALTE|nr:helix-turn-helix transcriptional regulator [Catenovulum sediminis]
MSQTAALTQALKSALKAHGKTYADVATHLQLTEASVKRLFAEQSFSLSRFDKVCRMLGLEITDIVQMMQAQQPQLKQLTIEQEKEITQDMSLLLITVCVLNKWTIEDIMQYNNFSQSQCIQKLAHLDRLKIIELLPRNKIKLLVSPNFQWIKNGPIQQFFQTQLGKEYFNAAFREDEECLIVLNGMLSAKSNAEFQRKLRRLAREFDELNNEDAGLPLDEKNGVTTVLAVRRWKYGLFNPFSKKQ